MKKVLITGCAGNIGSALADKLCKLGNYLVIGVDDLSTGELKKLPHNLNFKFVKIYNLFFYK